MLLSTSHYSQSFVYVLFMSSPWFSIVFFSFYCFFTYFAIAVFFRIQSQTRFIVIIDIVSYFHLYSRHIYWNWNAFRINDKHSIWIFRLMLAHCKKVPNWICLSFEIIPMWQTKFYSVCTKMFFPGKEINIKFFRRRRWRRLSVDRMNMNRYRSVIFEWIVK